MPTVIDELVVSVGLDASKFQTDTIEAERGISRTSEAARKNAQELETAGKRAGEFVGRLRGEFSQFLALFIGGAGVAGIERFFASIATHTAELGRNAAGIGMSTTELFKWQGAVKEVGGSAEGITQSFGNLSAALEHWKQTGDPGPFLANWRARIDQNITPSTDKVQLFLEAADKMSKMTLPEAIELGKQLGLDEGTVRLLHQGREAVEKLLGVYAKMAPSQADSDKFQQLEATFQRLKTAITAMGEAILVDFMPDLQQLMTTWSAWVSDPKNREWLETTLKQDLRAIVDTIKEVASAVNSVVQFFGGWKEASEILIGIWLGSKALTMVSTLTSVLKLLKDISGASSVASAVAGTVGRAAGIAGAGAEAVAGGAGLVAGATAGIALAGVGVAVGTYLANARGQDKIYQRARDLGWDVDLSSPHEPKFRKGGRTLDFAGMMKELGYGEYGMTLRQSMGWAAQPWESAPGVYKEGAELPASQQPQAPQPGGPVQLPPAATGAGGPVELPPSPAGPTQFAPTAPAPTGNARQDFYNQRYASLYRAALAAGAPHPETLAHIGASQAAGESGYGQSMPGGTGAGSSLNPYGIKEASIRGDRPGIAAATREGANSQFAITDRFSAFSSMEEADRTWVQYMQRDRYKGVWNAADVKTGLYQQAVSGYATASPESYVNLTGSAYMAHGGGVQGQPMVGASVAPPSVAPINAATQAPSISLARPPTTTVGIGAEAQGQRQQWLMNTSSRGDTDNSVTVGDVHVNTQATDATGISKDIGAQLRKYAYVQQANTGLA